MADGLRVAADIGGTFTDLAFIARDGLVATRKVPSTPGNYADAVIRGIDELMADLKLDKGADRRSSARRARSRPTPSSSTRARRPR